MTLDLDNIVLSHDGKVSRWNASGNPIVYKMQRKDFIFDQINNNGGFVQLQFNGVDLTSSFANTNNLYVKSDNGVYNSFATQTAEAFSGGNTLITTSIAYSSAAPGGFVNNDTLRPLYRVEVELYDSDNNLLTESPFEYSPNSQGEILIDVSIVRALLAPDISFDDKINIDGAQKKFYIKYREKWTGSANSQTSDSANLIDAVFGSRQIPAPYGGNLFEYVSFDGTPLSDWLTKLERPVIWRGFPFMLSVIAANDNDYNVLVEYYDAGGSLVDDDNFTLSTVGEKLLTINVTEVLAIPDDAVTCKVTFRDSAAGPVLTDLSEEIECDIVDPCDNPVLIIARNSIGGVIQWLFDYSQAYTFDYGNGKKAKRLILTTHNLTINQWEALQDLITLGEVYRNNIPELTSSTNKTSTRIGQQVYKVDPDGNKIGVVVIPTKNETLTKQVRHFVEIEIEYPVEFAL